jgi:hypothetical protein
MQAYLNDPKLKKDFVAEIKWHYDALDSVVSVVL